MADTKGPLLPARTVVFAHGFTQSGASWRPLIDVLSQQSIAAGWRLDAVCPDLPGHGTATSVVTDLWGAGDRLLDAADAVSTSIVGYSMGGRIALHAALAAPHRVDRLVLIGATAGIDDPWERSARRAADETLAERLEQIGVADFLDEWLRNPLFASLDPETALLDTRLVNTAEGLASSLRTCGTGTQEPLWARLGEISCPTLIVVGEDDPKFTSIGRRMVGRLPAAELAVVPAAGHSVQLERPDAVATLLAGFLAGA